MNIVLLDNCWIMIVLNNSNTPTVLDLSRQKELHTDPKVIQQIQLVEQLRKSRWCNSW